MPDERDSADLYVALDAEGGADVDLTLGKPARSNAELLETGGAVIPALLPRSGLRLVEVEPNEDGYPFVHGYAAEVYEPGAQPLIHIDTRAALAGLTDLGYRSVNIQIVAPHVPDTATWLAAPDSVEEGSWCWEGLAPGDAAPRGSILLHPQPWRGAAELGLNVSTLAGLIVAARALRRRRRLIAALAAAVAAAAAVTSIFTAGGVQADHLGVAGAIPGAALLLATAVSVVSLPAVVAAAGLLLGALVVRRSDQPARRGAVE